MFLLKSWKRKDEDWEMKKQMNIDKWTDLKRQTVTFSDDFMLMSRTDIRTKNSNNANFIEICSLQISCKYKRVCAYIFPVCYAKWYY